jgi:hypothetical protein
VAAPPQTLEALVRDELRGPVQEIVRRLVPELVPELVAEALNGATPAPMEPKGRERRNGGAVDEGLPGLRRDEARYGVRGRPSAVPSLP